MTNEGCMGNGRGTGQAHTCDSCTPEIPQAAIDAGAAVLNDWFEVPLSGPGCVTEVLRAALPHLLTEVKSMCETATAVGLALGRKEAGDIAADMIFGAAEEVGDCSQQEMLHDLAAMVRSVASQPPEPAPNGLTASSRHPGTPEDTKPPQEGQRYMCTWSGYPARDLPEESDQ